MGFAISGFKVGANDQNSLTLNKNVDDQYSFDMRFALASPIELPQGTELKTHHFMRIFSASSGVEITFNKTCPHTARDQFVKKIIASFAEVTDAPKLNEALSYVLKLPSEIDDIIIANWIILCETREERIKPLVEQIGRSIHRDRETISKITVTCDMPANDDGALEEEMTVECIPSEVEPGEVYFRPRIKGDLCRRRHAS